MNLYKITFTHYSQKDSAIGIKALILANNDEQVYEWLASEPKIGDSGLYNSYREKEPYVWDAEKESFVDEDGDEVDDFWEDENGLPETFKNRMIRLRGEENDKDYELHDLYYGLTLYGWGLLKENTTNDYAELIDLGVVFNADLLLNPEVVNK